MKKLMTFFIWLGVFLLLVMMLSFVGFFGIWELLLLAVVAALLVVVAGPGLRRRIRAERS